MSYPTNDGEVLDAATLNTGTLMYLFGDGADGDVTINSNTTVSADTHKNYNSLTVENGNTLTFEDRNYVYVDGVAAINGVIRCLKSDTTGPTRGGGLLYFAAAETQGSGEISCSGQDGSLINDTQEDGSDGVVSLPNYNNPTGGDKGEDGTDVSNGGAGGSGWGASADFHTYACEFIRHQSGNGGSARFGDTGINTEPYPAGPGGGGGGGIVSGGDGGDGDSTNSDDTETGDGGDGGGGGGVLVAFIGDNTAGTNLKLDASGGDGGDGDDKGNDVPGGGGGGGGGGLVFVVTNNAFTTDVSGGLGGSAGSGTGAQDGQDGTDGRLLEKVRN